MKSLFLQTASALLFTATLTPAQAVDLLPDAAPKFSSEQRTQSRTERKSEVLHLRATGQLPRAGEEYQNNMNYPKPVAGTHESRSAERKMIRAGLSDPTVRAQIFSNDNEYTRNGNAQPVISGTHESRQAERHARREEMRDLVRSGQMPVSNEADVMRIAR